MYAIWAAVIVGVAVSVLAHFAVLDGMRIKEEELVRACVHFRKERGRWPRSSDEIYQTVNEKHAIYVGWLEQSHFRFDTAHQDLEAPVIRLKVVGPQGLVNEFVVDPKDPDWSDKTSGSVWFSGR